MWNALVKIAAIVTFGMVVDDLGTKLIDRDYDIETSHNHNTGETKLRIQNQSDNRKRLPRS